MQPSWCPLFWPLRSLRALRWWSSIIRPVLWHPSSLLPWLPAPAVQSQGFVEDGKVRTIPLEVMVKGDKVPVYEETLEENGR